MSWHIAWEIQVLVWDIHKNVLTYCMRNPGHGLRYTQKCPDILHEKSRSWFEIYTNMSWHIAWEIQVMVWDIHKNVLTYCMRNPGPGLRCTQKCLDILHEKSRSWFEIYTKMSWHIAWEIQVLVWDIHKNVSTYCWEIQVLVWDINKNVLTYCMRNPGHGLRYTQKCLDILREKSRSWFEMYTKMSWHIAWEIQVLVWDIHKNILTYCVRNPGPGLRYTQTWVRVEVGNGMLILPCL
jgi:formylmethanofuran dehydrogenase subunit A